ncbi:MAG: MalY/PatB family protein [Spirochaetaceae bacterium]
MRYDFDTFIDRRGTASVKWDLTPPSAPSAESAAVSAPEESSAAAAAYPPVDGPLPAERMIPLWVADMDFTCPPAVGRALRERIEHEIFGYSLEPEGYREAVAAFVRQRHALEVDPRDIVSAEGVMPLVRAAVDAFTMPGEGVVVQPPVYTPFYSVVREKSRRLLHNPLERDAGGRYRMNLVDLKRQFRDGARMLLLCSPHNPVARVWERRELEQLAELATTYDVRIVSDEIHGDITMPGYAFTSFLHLEGASLAAAVETAVVCRSPSKTFNLPGIAASQAICRDRDTRRRLKEALHAAGHSLINPLGAVAARAAYREGGPWLDELLAYLDGNRRYLAERLDAEAAFGGLAPTPHEGTFVAWLDARGLLDRRGWNASELTGRLRASAGVWLSDGPGFGPGGEGYLRMNIGTPRAVLAQALDRMKEVL